MIRRLGWLVLLLVASPTWGATYYVSPSGSDANSCATATTTTQANNKLTIAAGVACATTAGDTVYLRAGTYTGSSNVIDSRNTVAGGSSFGSAITIAAYGGTTSTTPGPSPAAEVVTIRPPDNVAAIFLLTSAQTYLIFADLIIDMVNNTHDAITMNGNAGVYMSGGANHVRFLRLEVKNNIGSGMAFSDNGGNSPFNEILQCKIHDNGQRTSPLATNAGYGVYMFTSDNLLDGNDVYNNNAYGFHITGTSNAARNIVRNNKIHNNVMPVGGSSTTGGVSANGLILSGGADNVAYNNLVYNNQGGIQVYGNASNAQVYNNTVYNNNWQTGTYGPSAGITMQFYGSAPTIRNNIVYGHTNGDIIDYGGTGTPVVDHNLATNPSFTNAGAADFTLTAGSSAINAGTTVGSFSVDILGVSRPQGGTWDIGAYEATSATVTITTLLLADGQRTAVYSQQACATGGTTPYAWTVASGTIPAGTSLGTLTSTCATLSGTPTVATSYSFTLRVTDALSATVTQAYTVTIIDVTSTCSGGQGAWLIVADTCVGAGSSDGSASAVTAAVVTTGADFGLCAVADDKTTTQTPVSDSKANTWTLLTSTTSEYDRVAIFYSRYSSVGSGHTFSAVPVGGATSYPVIQCMSWSGSKSSPLDLAATTGAVTAGTSVVAGPLTWGKTSELVVSAAGLEVANSVGASGYTVYQRSFSSGKSFGVALGWKVYQRPVTTPEVATWTWAGPMSATAISGMFFNLESADPPVRFRFIR